MATELTVRGESIQALYNRYLTSRFQVNRRYQRKLVWGVDEKERLIDSIMLNLPVPLFLVAETGRDWEGQLEVIDGMQRLNAIFSFIENEFPINGQYFDLAALADTKQLVDSGHLTQRQPVLDREQCVEFSNYTLPLSVFRYDSSDSVDEAFRRINSGGRRLSAQELRQAGTISPLADIVRRISSRIRGDYSPTDIVPLQKMPELSISHRELDYGVNVNDIFWVKNGILRRDDLRLSMDEELVLDLLIDCMFETPRTSSRDLRNQYYDYTASESDWEGDRITRQLEVYGADRLEEDFFRAHDALASSLPARFATHIGLKSGGRAPRYWQAVFMAVFDLMNRDPKRDLSDSEGLSNSLNGISQSILSIPGGSGVWANDSKKQLISAVRGVIQENFSESVHREGPNHGWESQLQSIIDAAVIEQTLVEFKQGVKILNEERAIEKDIFVRLAKTATAMCNRGPRIEGYIVVGVADRKSDAERVEEIYGSPYTKRRNSYIVGLEREANHEQKSLQDYCEWIVNRISRIQGLSSDLSRQIRANYFVVDYLGHAVLVVRVRSGSSPEYFGDDLYGREGSSTVLLRAAAWRDVAQRFEMPPAG